MYSLGHFDIFMETIKKTKVGKTIVGKPTVHCLWFLWREDLAVIGYNTINIPDIF